MAVNKRKVLDTARKHAQKGAKQKALKEYNTLLKLDPRDAKLRLEIGDAHRRWGENEEAIGHYTKVADQYQQDGFDARAVAVFKQILNLDPKRYSAYVSLSELYQRMGLDSEAINSLQTAADGYHKEGKRREALELLRKMAQLDPSNTTSRLKVAELLQQEGLEEDALYEYEAVAEELVSQGETSAAESVWRRVLDLRPQRADVMILLARNAIRMRAPERAEDWARRAAELRPDDAEMLEVLCDVYKVLERTDDLVAATRRLAGIYRERGDEDMARTIMQRLPDAGAMDEAIDESAAVGVDALDTTDEALPDEDALLGDEDFLADDGTDVFEVGADDVGSDDAGAVDLDARSLDFGADLEIDEEPVAAAPPATSGSAALGDPEQMLAEASVYLRYGKTEQAIESLEGVLAQDPYHRAALEKLGEACSESGRNERAVEVWTRAAERAREEQDGESLDVLIARIEALDPEAATATRAEGERAEGERAEREGGGEDDTLGASDELDIDAIEIDDEVVPAAEARPEAAGAAQAPAEDAAADAGDLEIEIDEDLFGDDVDAVRDDVGASAEIEIDLDVDVEGVEATAEDAEADPAASSVDGASASRGGSSTVAEQIKEELEEAEFYFEQGMLVEAATIYRRILEVAPNHPSAMLRLGEIEAARDGAADDESDVTDATDATDAVATADVAEDGASAAPPRDQSAQDQTQPVEVQLDHEHDDDSFDLAAELAGAIAEDADDVAGAPSAAAPASDDDEAAFESLFSEFKKGVRATLGESDYETRYDLAIAYKEMGLLDDAISEFQVCVSSPSRALDSLQMLAQCALEVGRPSDAVEHLQQALSAEGLPAERRAGLYFDLARAFGEAGELSRALSTYENTIELDRSFPGVQQAVAELRERLNASSASEGSAGSRDPADAGLEVFDDLVAEASAEQAASSVSTTGAPAQPSVAPQPEPEVEIAVQPEPEATAEPEAIAEPEAEPETTVEPEPEAAGRPAPAAQPEPEAPEAEDEPSAARPQPEPRKRSRKKISFV